MTLLGDQVKRSRVVICSCLKNEGPYLLEWVAYHRLLGVDGFLLFDNDSNDGTSELLRDLDRIGVVNRVEWPTVAGVSPQISAFNHAIGKLSQCAEFVFNLDADEFIVPESGGLSEFLDSVADDVGAIAINQRVFGSGGEQEYRPLPVLERFVLASKPDYAENRFFKTLYRPSFAKKVTDPHYVHLARGRATHPDGSDLVTGDHPGASVEIQNDRIAIHHYILKSREEFEIKRSRGGGAAASSELRAARYSCDSFFLERDKHANACRADGLDAVLPKLKAEMQRLMQLCMYSRAVGGLHRADFLRNDESQVGTRVTVRNVPSAPDMEPEGMAALTECLSGARVFLDYGASGAVFMAGAAGVPLVITAGADETYLSKVSAGFSQFETQAQLVTCPVDIGSVNEWEYPLMPEAAHKWPAYSASPWALASDLKKCPDVVLIKGRFRVACFLVSLLESAPGGVILFDDYVDRDHYHEIESILPPTRCHGRLAVFEVPSGVRFDRAVRMLMKYAADPR